MRWFLGLPCPEVLYVVQIVQTFARMRFCDLRNSAGVIPVAFLKTRVKEESEEYPAFSAALVRVAPGSLRTFLASSILSIP